MTKDSTHKVDISVIYHCTEQLPNVCNNHIAVSYCLVGQEIGPGLRWVILLLHVWSQLGTLSDIPVVDELAWRVQVTSCTSVML